MKVLVSDNLSATGVEILKKESGLEVDVKTGLSKEELIKMFEPNFKDDLVGVHHVSQFEDGFLFDSCKKYIK